MADIEYVQAGQKVRASTLNSIIDTLGGLDSPCDGFSFQRTSSGSLFMSPEQVEGAPAQHAPQLFDVAWGPALSGEQELVMNFGRSLESTAEILGSHPLSVFFRDFSGSKCSAGKLVELVEEDFQPNGEGKWFDGWVRTGIYGLESEASSGSSQAGGVLWLWQLEGGSSSEYAKAWVITNAADLSSFKSELESKMGWSSCWEDSKTPLAVQVSGSLEAGEEGAPAGGTLIRVHTSAPKSSGVPCLFQLRAKIETRAGSEGAEERRATFQWWNNESVTGGGVKWNTLAFEYGGESTGPQWTDLSSTEWTTGSLMEGELTAWLEVEAAGASEASTGEYLTVKKWNVVTEKGEEKCQIGGRPGQLGSRWVKTYFPIGRFHCSGAGSGVDVTQCLLGSLNMVDMAWGGDGGQIEPLPGDDSQRYTADSLISAAQMSSLARESYAYEYQAELSDGTISTCTATGYWFSLYNFKHAEDALTLSVKLSDDYHIDDRLLFLVRDSQAEIGKETQPVLKYAHLCIEPATLSVDSMVSGTDSYSVQLSNFDKDARIAQLYGFTKEERGGVITLSSDMSALPEGTLLLARVKEGDAFKLKYMDLSCSLSGGGAGNLVSADSDVASLSSKSLQVREFTQDDGTSAVALQLYGFEKDNAEPAPAEASSWSLLARQDNELKYLTLSSLQQAKVDTELTSMEQESLERVSSSGQEVLQLHGFGEASKLDLKISQEEPSLSDGIELLSRVHDKETGITSLEYAKLTVDFGDLRALSADTEEAEPSTKSIDCQGDVLRLHNFSGSSRGVSLKLEDTTSGKQIPGDVSLLVRQDNELKYASLEVDFPELSSEDSFKKLSGFFTADSASDLGISSVQEIEKGGKKVFSLWQFSDRENSVKKGEVTWNSDLLLRDKDAMDVKWVSLSSVTHGVDSSVPEAACSTIIEISSEGQQPLLGLHGFTTAEAESAVISIRLLSGETSDAREVIPGDLLIRKTTEDGSSELAYMSLSAMSLIAPDTRYMGQGTEGSIDFTELYEGVQQLELKGWSGDGKELTYGLTAVSSDEGAVFESPKEQVTHFLVRQEEGVQNCQDLQYAKLKLTLPLSAMPSGSDVSGDADLEGSSQKSIQRVSGQEALQIYGFGDKAAEITELSLGLNSDEAVVSPEMLCREGSSPKEVSYKKLSLKSLIDVDHNWSSSGGGSINATSEGDLQVLGLNDWGNDNGEAILTSNDLSEWATEIQPIELENTSELGLVLHNKDGALQYSKLKVRLPVAPQPDSAGGSLTYSLERTWGGSPHVAYDSLYGFGSAKAQEITSTIVNGGSVDLLHGVDVLVRNGNELQYRRVQLSCPEISGDVSKMQDEIDKLTNDVLALSSDISGLSSELSGLDSKYWKLGGGAGDCYGAAIGDSSQQAVVGLDSKSLAGGDWSVTEGALTVRDHLEVSGFIDTTDVNASRDVLAQGEIAAGGDVTAAGSLASQAGTLTLGSTSLTEAQLKKLLALIS